MRNNPHSNQCLAIGGGPGHDRCICYCHTTLGTTVTITKDQLVDAILTTDDPIVESSRWHDAVFDDLLTRTGHQWATADKDTVSRTEDAHRLARQNYPELADAARAAIPGDER